MDKLGLKRYCCRRMVLTHVDLIEKLLQLSIDSFLMVAFKFGQNVTVFLTFDSTASFPNSYGAQTRR
jgi:hypothetical protein